MDKILKLNKGIEDKIFLGLNKDQVAASRALKGANILTRKKKKSFLKNLLENFGDPMIKILLIALGINVIFVFRQSNWFDSVGIAVAILTAILVSTISEYGSEAAFEKLQKNSENITCRVKRDGKTILLPVSEIVVDDIVLLSAGDKIPADGIIVQGRIEVDQSPLNGESKPAHKFYDKHNIGSCKEDDFFNNEMLFSGTVVDDGEAVMRVTAVGDNTAYGKLALEIQESSPESPLKLKLMELAKKISLFGYVGAGLVALSYLFNVFILDNHFNGALIIESVSDIKILLPHLLNAVTLAVTVIVMAVPEGLPMMITVVLSSNMRRMLKDNVLVRKLNGIETAGSMNILFTDKTGTLTKGKLDVVNIVTGDLIVHNSQEFYKPKALNDILYLSLKYNNSSEIINGKAIGSNATDRAIMEFANSISSANIAVKKVHSIPFNSTNKFMATKISGSKNLTLIKGAPEKILKACSKYYDNNGSVQLFNKLNGIQKILENLSEHAMRIIAVATSQEDVTLNNEFKDLTLVALIAIRDQIRKEAIKGVKKVQSAGIQTVMITGDSKPTAIAIAKETGILDKNGIVLTSNEMAGMSDDELKNILKELRVVARALPTDKSRLVRIAQSLNLVTGMTGDGVNDAPALKKADIGFAMGSGTEVAKEAGMIVIMDDNINSISNAVLYGRTIYKSIRKFIIFQLTLNFCAVVVSIVAPLLRVDTPITIMQMLWINLVMDTLAGLAFGGERPREKYMHEPPKNKNEPIINKYMWQQVFVISAFTALLSLWFLKSSALQGLFPTAAYSMTAFFALFMFVAIFNSFNARTHELNLFDNLKSNKNYISIMLSVTVIQILIIYFGGSLFRTVGLKFEHLLMVVLIAFLVVPIDLMRKIIMRRYGKNQGT